MTTYHLFAFYYLRVAAAEMPLNLCKPACGAAVFYLRCTRAFSSEPARTRYYTSPIRKALAVQIEESSWTTCKSSTKNTWNGKAILRSLS